MTMLSDGKKSLIQSLVDEASDVDLVCYLAHTGGSELLRDLLECVRDAEFLSTDALVHNISVIRQKKVEAYACPMHRVFRRLMRPHPGSPGHLAEATKLPAGEELRPSAALH